MVAIGWGSKFGRTSAQRLLQAPDLAVDYVDEWGFGSAPPATSRARHPKLIKRWLWLCRIAVVWPLPTLKPTNKITVQSHAADIH